MSHTITIHIPVSAVCYPYLECLCERFIYQLHCS